MDNTPAAPQDPKQDQFNLDSLTPENWAFIKHYLKSGKVLESYRVAGYEGADSAAYVLMHRLKDKIATIQELHGVTRARLLIEIGRLNDLPLDEKKKSVTVSEKLRIIKAAKSLVPEMSETQAKPSVFIINRANTQNIEVSSQKSIRAAQNGPVIEVPADVVDTDDTDLDDLSTDESTND